MSSFNAKDETQTNGYGNAGKQARPHGTVRKKRPVNFPALVPPPHRNSVLGRTVIHFTHKLEDILPSEQIKHDSGAGEN